MKVCWITSSYIKDRNDSTSFFLHELAKSLESRGIEIHIITPNSKSSMREEIIDGVIIHRFDFIPQKYDKLTYGSGMAINLKKHFIAKFQLLPYILSCMHLFNNLHKKEKFDLIHAHWAFPSGFIGYVLRNINNIPLITTLHGTEIFLANKYRAARYLIRYCLIQSDDVIANSFYTMQQAKKIHARNYTVIPMGINMEKYYPLTTNKIVELKAKFGLSGRSILLTICRLIERKGVQYILDSMNYVKSSNICVIIVGNGPEKNKLIKRANDLMLKNNELKIMFKSSISEAELIQLHQICDIELLTSIEDDSGETEGLGVVLIEGGACGKPLIGSNVGGISDIIINGFNGFLVEQKNSNMLAKKIDYILENRDIIEFMSNNSRMNTVKVFDINNVVTKQINVYERILQEKI